MPQSGRRPQHHSRHFERAEATSACPQIPDIALHRITLGDQFAEARRMAAHFAKLPELRE